MLKLYYVDVGLLKLILLLFGCAGSFLLHGLFCSCGERGVTLTAVLGLPIVGACLVVEHGLYGARGSVAVVPRL